MAKWSLKVHGGPGLLGYLASVHPAVRHNIRKRNEKMARQVADRARAAVPIDRGYLLASITERTYPRILSWEVFCDPQVFADIPTGPEEPYDWFVEFGTENTPAQPFMNPAFLSKVNWYQNGIRDDITDGFLLRWK